MFQALLLWQLRSIFTEVVVHHDINVLLFILLEIPSLPIFLFLLTLFAHLVWNTEFNVWRLIVFAPFLIIIIIIIIIKSPKQSLGDLLFLLRFLLLFLLSLSNNVWKLIVFAPFLIIILILSFREAWTCPRQISGTTGQNFMKLGGVIDICF